MWYGSQRETAPPETRGAVEHVAHRVGPAFRHKSCPFHAVPAQSLAAGCPGWRWGCVFVTSFRWQPSLRAVENECMNSGRGSGWGTNSAYYNKWVAQENTDKCQLWFEFKPTDSEFGAFSLELNRNQSFYFTKKKKKASCYMQRWNQSYVVQTFSRECFDAVDHIVLMRTRLHHGLIFWILWMWDSEGTNPCYLKSYLIGQEVRKLQMTSLLKPRETKWSVSTGSLLYIQA